MLPRVDITAGTVSESIPSISESNHRREPPGRAEGIADLQILGAMAPVCGERVATGTAMTTIPPSGCANALIEDGSITVDGSVIRFERDVLFRSSSAAASVAAAGAWGRRVGWKHQSGRTLADLEHGLLASSDEDLE